MLHSSDIRICEYMRAVVDSSRRIYEARKDLEDAGSRRRAGEPVQGVGRQNALAYPRAVGKQRSVRLPHPRQPGPSAGERLPASGVSAEERSRRSTPRRCVDALSGLEIAASRDSERRRGGGGRVAAAASHDSGPETVSTFVRTAVRTRQPRWRSLLCASGPGVAAMTIEPGSGRDLPEIRALLARLQLPLAGVDEHLRTMLVAREDEEI